MTKLFSEYLTESKRVFEFKVKIAGELPEGFKKKVKMDLDSPIYNFFYGRPLIL